jgi:hypothetical protein
MFSNAVVKNHLDYLLFEWYCTANFMPGALVLFRKEITIMLSEGSSVCFLPRHPVTFERTDQFP